MPSEAGRPGPFEFEIRRDGPLSDAGREFARSIAGLDSLPSLPEVLLDILEVIGDETSNIDEVIGRLELDLALCSKILKLVNSAFYGFPSRIDGLQRAVVLLGFNTIKQVALGATVMDLFSVDAADGFDPHRQWHHSVLTGTAAAVLGARLGFDRRRDSLFLAGLLHDVGKFLFREVAPERQAVAIDRSLDEGLPLVLAERAEFGLDHAEAGALLARTWGFPAGLVDLIRSHHWRPSTVRRAPAVEGEALALFVANRMAHRLLDGEQATAGRSEEDWREVEDLLVYWGITPTERNQMETEVQRRADGALQALDVHGL